MEAETKGFRWPEGQLAAISLAYEACPAEALLTLSEIEAHGYRGTTFLSPTELLENPREWSQAVRRGHEVGDGTLVGLSDDGRLTNWTLQMIKEDLESTALLLDEWAPTRYGRVGVAPGRYLEAANGDYMEQLEHAFAATLSTQAGVNHPIFCSPSALLQLQVGTLPVTDMMSQLESAVDKGAWTILNFNLTSEGVQEIHKSLLEILAEAFPYVWVAPIGEVANQVTSFRARLSLR